MNILIIIMYVYIKLNNAYTLIRKNHYLYYVYKKYSVFCEFSFIN
jgi:hypothetical protein